MVVMGRSIALLNSKILHRQKIGLYPIFYISVLYVFLYFKQIFGREDGINRVSLLIHLDES